MTKEVMQQALEALESAVRYHGIMLMADPPQAAWKYHRVEDNAKQAITSLREALEQPRQEPKPVACRFCHSKKGCWTWQCYSCGEIDDVQQPAPLLVQQAEPCIGKDPRCPCQDGDACHYKDCGGTKAWPAQRPWVGLTDEEIAQGNKESWVTEQAWQSAVWWAEARLKEKNNG
jgi:hypothetical protein